MPREEMVVDVSQDYVLACDVQQGFMQAPCTISDSFDYGARCRQVRALGGDCYNFIPLKNGQVALAIGDASGKGLAAALMMAMYSRHFAQRRCSPKTWAQCSRS